MANETRKTHANINRVVLSGRIAQDANYMPAQVDAQGNTTKQSIAYFTLANNEGWTRRDGSEAVSFINCQVTGKYADAVAQYLLKGTFLTISGMIKAWTEKDETTGQIKGNNYIIHVEDMDMAPRPQNQVAAPTAPQPQVAPQAPTQAAPQYQAAPQQAPVQAAQQYQAPVAPQPPVQAAPQQYQAAPQQAPVQAAQQYQAPAAPQQNGNPFQAAPQQGFAYSNNPFEAGGFDASARFAMN